MRVRQKEEWPAICLHMKIPRNMCVIFDLYSSAQCSVWLRALLTRATVVIDKVEYHLIPHQSVGRVFNDMALIREVEKLAGHPVLLEQIEEHHALALCESVVQRVVDNNVRRRPVLNVEERVEVVVRVAWPEGGRVDGTQEVVEGEAEEVRRALRLGQAEPFICDQGFEIAAKVLSLDPVSRSLSVLTGPGRGWLISCRVEPLTS